MIPNSLLVPTAVGKPIDGYGKERCLKVAEFEAKSKAADAGSEDPTGGGLSHQDGGVTAFVSGAKGLEGICLKVVWPVMIC